MSAMVDPTVAREKIFNLAVFSRLSVLLIQCAANKLLPHHEPDAFTSPLSPGETDRPLDGIVLFLLDGLPHWDGQYFIHVARYGYTYLNTVAFFPMLPMAGSLLASLLSPLTVLVSPSILFLLIFSALNAFCFVRAAVCLLDLGVLLFPHNSIIPYRAAVLFCFNPASIFFSAPYSESVFALATFSGLARMHTRLQPLSTLTVLALSSGCRSNGLLNLLHPLLCYLRQRRLHLAVLAILLVPLPFLLFQVFSYGRFCLDPGYSLPLFLLQHARENGYMPAGEAPQPPFCMADAFELPYQFVQRQHWDVGFLRYFTWRQLPNFILTAPLLVLVLPAGWIYFWRHPRHCLTLGLLEVERPKVVYNALPLSVLPLVAHLGFLTVFCFFCVHVQVSTRMIASSCPAFYWVAALWMCETDIKPEKKQNLLSKWRCFLFCDNLLDWKAHFVRLYFLSYFVMGTILFSLNLPWT